MKNPSNPFLAALRAGQSPIGLWVGLVDANAAESLAGCGFDWLLLDAEHAPNDVRTILDQLRAVAPYPSHPIVRPPVADVALIKRYLDIGVQTFLVPMIDTPEQASLMARAMRYPPRGIRGVGASLARASRWNQIDNYIHVADEEICLLVQAETPTAIGNLKAIAQTDGVDGVFFGPADLSATMGYRGQPTHPAVHRVILDGIATVRAAGKAAGLIATDATLAREYLQAGAQFVAVGVDALLLVKAARDLATAFGRKA
jgi:4-hydroxy-2-oxoheptanedioate aldolase